MPGNDSRNNTEANMNSTLEQSLDAIQSPKIRAIVSKSACSFISLMSHKETELIEVMQDVEEGKTISISHTLTLDLGKNNQRDQIAFSAKHQIRCDGEIPNPDQANLPLDSNNGEEGA